MVAAGGGDRSPCPSCGHEVDLSNDRCPDCQAQLNATDMESSEPRDHIAKVVDVPAEASTCSMEVESDQDHVDVADTPEVDSDQHDLGNQLSEIHIGDQAGNDNARTDNANETIPGTGGAVSNCETESDKTLEHESSFEKTEELVVVSGHFGEPNAPECSLGHGSDSTGMGPAAVHEGQTFDGKDPSLPDASGDGLAKVSSSVEQSTQRDQCKKGSPESDGAGDQTWEIIEKDEVQVTQANDKKNQTQFNIDNVSVPKDVDNDTDRKDNINSDILIVDDGIRDAEMMQKLDPKLSMKVPVCDINPDSLIVDDGIRDAEMMQKLDPKLSTKVPVCEEGDKGTAGSPVSKKLNVAVEADEKQGVAPTGNSNNRRSVPFMCGLDDRHPRCDGYDSDEEIDCHRPIDESRFCPSCGKKNKFIRCNEQHGDGTACKMLYVKGTSCPCCSQANAPLLAPPVCDGLLDGKPCGQPITGDKFCNSCGSKNKYIQCKGHREDGNLCKMFVEPETTCPWCQTVAKARKSQKKQVTQEVFGKEGPVVKDTELRAKPEEEPEVQQSRATMKENPTGNRGHSDDQGANESDAERNQSMASATRRQHQIPPADESEFFKQNGNSQEIPSNDVVQQAHGITERPGQSQSLFYNQASVPQHQPEGLAKEKVFGDPEVKVDHAKHAGSAAPVTEPKGEKGAEDEKRMETDKQNTEHRSYASALSVKLQATPLGESAGDDAHYSNCGNLHPGRDDGSHGSGDAGEKSATSADKDSEEVLAANGEERSEKMDTTPAKNGRKRECEDPLNDGDSKKKPKETAYRKSDHPPADYVQGNVTKEKRASERLKNRKTNVSNEIDVVQLRKVRFHVVLHKHFKFNQNEDVLVIKFGNDHLGGWNVTKYEMKFVKEFSESYKLFEGTVELPPSVVRSPYKYCLIRHMHSKKETKHVWEWMTNHVKDEQERINRSLRMDCKEAKEKMEMDQYDGLIYPPPDQSWWEKITKAGKKLVGYEKKQIIEEVKEATYAMLPRWHWLGFESMAGQPLEHLRAEDAFRSINNVFKYMEKSFSTYGSYPKIDGWKEVFWEYLSSWKSSMSSLLSQKDLPKQAQEMCLVSALTVLRLSIIDNTLVADKDEMELLCDCLLLRPGEDGKILPFFETLQKHFDEPHCLVEPLMMLCTNLVNTPNFEIKTVHKWTFLVPLIHFLSGEAKPYEPVWDQYGYEHNHQNWWGIETIFKCQQKFQSRVSSMEVLDQKFLLDHLVPLFDVDHLLPRTLMCLLSYKHIATAYEEDAFPLSCCIANCYYFIKMFRNQTYLLDETIRPMHRCLELLVTKAEKTFESETNRDQLELVTMEIRGVETLAWNLLDLFITVTQPAYSWNRAYSILPYCVDLMAKVLNAHLRIIEWMPQDHKKKIDDSHNIVDGHFHEMSELIIRWLRTVLMGWRVVDYNMFKNQHEPKLWSDLMNIRFFPEERCKVWIDRLVDQLETRIDRTLTSRQKVEMYCGPEDFSKYNKAIDDCFSKKAFEALDTVVNLMDIDHYDSYRYKGVVSRMFEKNWDKAVSTAEETSEVHKILRHILSWPTFGRCLEVFSTAKRETVFNVVCIERITQAVSILSEKKEQFTKHTITVSDFEVLAKNKDAFINLCCIELMRGDSMGKTKEMCNAQKASLHEHLMKMFQLRQDELHYYRDVVAGLLELISHCNHLTCGVYTSDLADVLKKDIGPMPVHDVIVPSEELYANDDVPKIVRFGVSQSVLDMLPKVGALRESFLLSKEWEEFDGRVEENCADPQLQLDEVIEHIWKPTWAEWCKIVGILATGNITLHDVDKYLGCFDKKSNDIIIELQCMKKYVDESLNVADVSGWIDLYYRLEAYKEGAQTILSVRDEMGYTGDFKQVEVLACVTRHKDVQLNTMSRDLLETGEFLQNITGAQVRCLKAVAQCKELVKWFRELGETKDLETLVELAGTSAGEGDMDIDRVKWLHAVVTGYAPLISDAKENASAEVFLDHCKMVWRSLESDPELPEKLYEMQRQMPWLNFVKESHGSVEVSSLSEVEAINARGIYRVGFLKKGHKEIIDIIELGVPPEKVGDHKRSYNFDQLNELQSKLMLVSSSKRAEAYDEMRGSAVDRFTEIFEGVTRLAKAYVKICSAGNILFQNWVSTLFCSPNKPMNIHIDFQIADTVLKDENQRGLAQQIHNLAKFMEDCLWDWQEYLKKQRSQYPQLNHFTTAQIVTLRQEFAKVTCNEPVDDLTYNLLHSVKQNCVKDDLLAAVRAAHVRLQEAASDEEEAEDTDMPEEEEVPGFGELKQKIMDAGYTERLAILAISKCGQDFDNCFCWCMANEDKVPEDGEFPMDEEEEDLLTDLDRLQPETSMETVTTKLLQQLDTTAERSLCERLKQLWEKFLCAVSTSVRDYLSVEHIGLILDCLSDRETSRIERSFPPYLRAGRPNLVVCPEAEIHKSVLSLYMDDPNLPLPSEEEVLLCTKSTTAEEVELLWQRATCNTMKQGKIFCLVNADRLDYDVSDAVEKSLDKHIKGKHGYRLVIICSSEREDTSRMVTALDRDRRNPIIRSTAEVKGYLMRQFQKDAATAGGRAGPNLDVEKSSVRLVTSTRAGVGKSLFAQRVGKELHQKLGGTTVRVQLHERAVTDSNLVEKLLQYAGRGYPNKPRLFHIDIGHDVVDGVDHVLFNLLVLRCIKDGAGQCWRRFSPDLYIIENLPLLKREVQRTTEAERVHYVHQILDILPSVMCRPPRETLQILRNEGRPEGVSRHDPLLHNDLVTSEEFQRPYRHLKYLTQGQERPDTPFYWLELLLRFCGVENPSWSELTHFISFLNIQLRDCEHSIFCSQALHEDLPGFTMFVVRFMIQMSKDFATRSVNISEETPRLVQGEEEQAEDDSDGDLLIALRRTWETSPHPYIFFNPDRHSITFLGFNIDKATGNLKDLQTGAILQTNIMHPVLFDALIRNGVNLLENFDRLSRFDKITKLCTVMGIEDVYDPDETYELTTDNVKKMLAIYMRFRCDIPVVVMGETGCGKTRLIRFMCDLQAMPGADVRNMVLMKVHGGTSNAEITKKVREAQALAEQNRQNFPKMDTILFFDEANTTESISLIKEIMCDHTMNGEPIRRNTGLKFVAACNPYRKHSQEMIHNLEQAGLGYNVKADETTDKLGRVPMRQLVYRVQPLPQSMLPLVWDFGQLSDDVEKMYIRQIVQRYIQNKKLPEVHGLNDVITNILAASQDFMRGQNDECSFVSLRDVERTMDVMSWFYSQRNLLYKLMDGGKEEDVDEDEEMAQEDDQYRPDDVTRSLILALGVCYHACLQDATRGEYRQHLAQYFREPCRLPEGSITIDEEITTCQDVFLEQVKIDQPNIAPNQALKENLFMMVVCIELRIPLFLVGKPGSSKSLAKLIVTDAMKGYSSKMPLFKALKQVHMVSFQCSPLATPDGIKSTFRQCARFQEDKNLGQFVSVVVLDEVGLAEDSPRMPLKTLHPLLEDGTSDADEKPAPHKRVAFIGISNWALDPAKMNRGILVQRGVPDEGELIKSAEGICSTDPKVLAQIKSIIPNMAKAYLDLYNSAMEIREFFGLRDFYSLVKMVYAFANRSRKPPTWYQLEHAVRRNFGGLEQTDPVKVFADHVHMRRRGQKREADDPPCDTAGLIEACLRGNQVYKESRYLLILTENYAALGILQQYLLDMEDTIVIFGSSFRSDQEYTQVCRNINRIKKCMDTGKTVVLLNLESLYESLYDALNQYYSSMCGQRYVDLGLGTHRVKCRVDENFRLIVVAEKTVVYEKFPIPLINRLEKHFLATTTILTERQNKVTERLEVWAKNFVTKRDHLQMHQTRRKVKELKPGDVFCGYHADTAASVILQVSKKLNDDSIPGWAEQVYGHCKDILLACATPDSVLRLKETNLDKDEKKLVMRYFENNSHRSLQHHFKGLLDRAQEDEDIFLEVTTRSHLLAKKDAKELAEFAEIGHCKLLALQAMDTKQQFSRELRDFFTQDRPEQVMLLQCDSGDLNSNLIACARYQIMEEYNKSRDNSRGRTHFIFIIQMPRVVAGSFVGFQGGKWHSVYLDELRPPLGSLPSVINMRDQSISSLVQRAVEHDTRRTEEEARRESPMDVPLGDVSRVAAEPVPMEVSTDSLNTEDIMLVDPEKEQNAPTATELLAIMKGQKVQPHPGCGAQEMDERPIQEMDTADDVTVDDGQQTLDVAALILSCLQSAASMVKDPDIVPTDRATERLQILSKELAKNEGGPSLMDAIKIRISWLLCEKEKKVMIPTLASSWLSKEAASHESINRAGTFCRSVWMVIENKVIPILSALVAYVDTNGNLDILQRQQTIRDKWIHSLWLRMLTDPQATPISYERILSPKMQEEVTEVIAQQTSRDQRRFKPQFPFSWEVFSQMEAIIQTVQTTKEEGREQTCQKLFGESAIGKFFNRFLTDHPVTTHDELMDLYLSDFINMTFRQGQEGMHQILTKTLKAAFRETRQSLARGDEDQFGQMTIPKLHLTYAQYRERIDHFIQTCSIWPECVEWLQKNPNHELNSTCTEMTLDVNVMVQMVDFICSLEEKLKTLRGRQEWIDWVKTFKPIIERILQLDSHHRIGPTCQTFLEKYRPLWTRISVVQLFIDHVCPPHIKEEAGRVDTIWPLWKFLSGAANFHTAASLEKVAKFMKSCKSMVVKALYKTDAQCLECKEPMKDSIELPCKHKICHPCYKDQVDSDSRQCLECKKEIPAEFTPKLATGNKKADVGYNRYIRACNEFFMDLVSQHCFADEEPPNDEVIKILMSYIIHEPRKQVKDAQPRTKELTVYQECIDPTPVLRSHLLQLLLRYSSEDVMEHLQYYFEKSQRFLTDQKHIIELALLCVRCFEDSYHSLRWFLKDASTALEARVKVATQFLNDARKDLARPGLDIHKIEAIAKTRFGMSVAAEMMQRIVIRREENHDNMAAGRLWEVAHRLHDACQSRWPRLYLVKQLCRNYGMDSLQAVTQHRPLAWVLPDEAKAREDNSVDRFILSHKNYTLLRDAVSALTLGGTVDELIQKFQGLQGSNHVREVACLLALHREVYSHNLFERDENLRVSDEVIDNINNVCNQQKFLKNKTALRDILEVVKSNKIQPVMDRVDNTTKALLDLLTQTTLVMQSLKESPLLKPLKTLMTKAGSMKDSYLPVMPQDHLEEARQVLLTSRGTGNNYDENPVFYTCNRGHPYVIGNCGRPAVRAVCWCGSDIGGVGYVPAAGNQILNHRDETKKGHVLGAANLGDLTPVPERSLSPAATTILRLLLHLSMHIGTKYDPQGVASLINPPVQVEQVRNFLLDHIRRDINVLSRAVGKSPDDCLILMTILVASFMEERRSNKQFNPDLRTKEARRDWEIAFCDTYINPLLNGLDAVINEANHRLVNDDRLSNNPLIKIVHEVLNFGDNVDISKIHDSHMMWQFRSRVSVEHLTQLMNERATGQNAAQAKILRQFLQEEHHLRLMRHLPAIIKLQHLLLQKYQRKVSQSEARSIMLKDVLKELTEQQKSEWLPLLESFKTAWKGVQDTLPNYNASGITLPEEYCKMSITPNTPVAMLIPSLQGLGLCSVMLVEFLVRKHNDFIMAYCRYRKKNSSKLPSFSVKEVTPAHLIYYDPEKDLLPMVLAHCNYSLEVGKGTVINYDFHGLERELEERLLRGRPKLMFEHTPVVFRGEFSNAAVFTSLREKINQEPMSHAIQVQITLENRVYIDLCNTLANLDVAITFLLSVGGDPETKLENFMTETLILNKKILSPQIRQHCLLKHVQSLWLVLSMEKSKQLKYFQQDAFETVNPVYHDPIEEDQLNTAVQHALHNLNIDIFVAELFECILLNINIEHNRNDEDFQDNAEYSLADVLHEYIDSKNGTEIPALINGTFPKEVKVRQAIAVWGEAVLIQRKEETKRNR